MMFALLITLPLLLMALWFETLCALTLYRWFALPLGAPAVTLAHAVGLNLCISLIARQMSLSKIEDDPWSLAKRLAGYLVVTPATSVAIGWVIKRVWL